MIPILITTAVTPNDPSSVKLSNFHLRREYILNAIKEWQKISTATELIICDGSNYCFKDYLAQNNVNIEKIEFLQFANDNSLVKLFGKGYGESEIIKYALYNSKILKEHKYFAKCTGKLWVKNFEEATKNYCNSPCLLMPIFSKKKLSKLTIEYVDTRFYIFEKDFYLQNFLNLYTKNNIGVSIEDLFLDKIIEMKLTNIFFSKPLIISGISGASGKYYNTKLYRIVKDYIKYYFWKKSIYFQNPFLLSKLHHKERK